MLIETVHVKHFRSLFDETLDCRPLTALVGRNGTGKSAFLRAIELFYAVVPQVDRDDFYNRDTGDPIEITITFRVTSDSAQELFATYMEGDALTVVRVISWAVEKFVTKLHGSRLQAPDFGPIREATTATAKKPLYEALKGTHAYGDLPPWKNQTQGAEALQEWEANHATRLVRLRDEGQFFGFEEVAQGYLGRFTRLLPIHAVRDVSADAKERKGSVLTDLMDLVVRSVIAQKDEVRMLKEDTQRQYEEILNPEHLTELSSLSGDLTTTLQSFVPDSAVKLIWQPLEAVSIPMPKADVKLVEDEFESSVDRTGHGLQRAFVMTLLQHLARSQMPAAATTAGASANDATNEGSHLPNLVLSIEEPELYQHPNRQRHFSSVLLKLALGAVPGVADRTQILYSTHSPFFVGIDRIDSVRLFRKCPGKATFPKITSVVSTSLDRVAEFVWQANGSSGEKYTGETLRPRLHSIMTPWMNEGFFADQVVLVEGEDDRAAILGAARRRDIDFEAAGVSVLPCFGKTNMDRPAIIFREMGIPVYLVWVADKEDPDAKPEDNHRLLRLLGVPVVDWPSGVFSEHACFEKCLDLTLRSELGETEYDSFLGHSQKYFGIAKKKHAVKNPAVVEQILRFAADVGRPCATLDSIIDRILESRSAETSSPPS